MSSEYIAIGYKPTTKDLVCEYHLEPARGLSLEEAAGHLAGESSIGTWTTVATMKPRIAKTLAPKILKVDKNRRMVQIAYAQELFEEGNVPQILSAIAGNIFGMKAVENLRLLDVIFPTKLIKSFKGPAFGIEGVRKTVKIWGRPLTGTIVKPKVGLNPKEHALCAYEAWVGGLQVVKDDENLSSMSFNKFEERVVKVLEARDKAEQETGEKKLAVLNVTAETNEMLHRAQFIKDHGGNVAMIDIVTVGWSGLQTLRNANFGLILHGHRAGHAAIDRNPKHGIAMRVIAKFARLVGIDQLHIGTHGVGKMVEVTEGEDVLIQKAITEKMNGIKSVLPICSGGLHPGHVPALIKAAGKDIIMQFGGGCHGHPNGTRAGAAAIRQAVDATMQGVSLQEYAETHIELKEALDYWGYLRPR